MKAAAWLCPGPLGHFAAGGESRRPGEAALCWEARVDAQTGDGGLEHWDAAQVMDRGLRSHRPALPACPVPKFPVEMVMLLQTRLPGPPNLGYRPPTGDISGWCPFQPSPVQGERQDMHLAANPWQYNPSSWACATPRPPPADFGPGWAPLLPNPGDRSLESKPKLAHARFLCPTGSSARDRARIKDAIAEGITRSPRWALRSQQIACAVGAGKHKTSCLCI